jgi:N utilization substance protein B
MRKARTAALQVLYEVDCAGHPVAETLQRTLEEAVLPDDARRLSTVLVHGVDGHRARLDEVIARHAPDYPVDQLSIVERNILRIAIFEILVNNGAPPKVAINEAVELAKVFGSQNIHRFINGVLGSVLDDEARIAETPIPGGSSADRL